MRILITGGAGFIGSNLALRLQRDPANHEITVLDNFSNGDFPNLIDFHGNVIAAGCDLAEPCHRCDVIFHQASITDTTVTDQLHMMQNNVEGFRHVLGWAAKWGARVVWASSAAVYGNLPAPNKLTDTPRPLNVYGYSKLAMERLARLWALEHPKLPIIGLRYFNVYGPGEAHKGKFASMIWQLALQMKAGKRPRVFTPGTQKRDFVSIQDVIAANLLAMSAPHPDHPTTPDHSLLAPVYNVGSGIAHSFNDVINALNDVLGTNLPPDYFDNPYPFFQNRTQADIAETTRALNYVPQYTSIGPGIAAYMKAYS